MASTPDLQQAAVIAHRSGPAVVYAVPGAGKTTTSIALMVSLLNEGWPPESIVSITFTREATNTTRARLAKAVGAEVAHRVTIATFHSLALQIVRQLGPKLRWPAFEIADDAQLLRTLFEVTLAPGPNNPDGCNVPGVSLDEARAAIDAARAAGFHHGAPPSGMDASHVQMWAGFQAAKRRRGLVDFYDLIEMAAAALSDPALGAQWRSSVRAVLIDEVQDLNAVQLRLAQQLGGEMLVAVGDPMQSLYSFQGSSPQWCLNFDTYFPGTTVYRIERCYRCPVDVLRAARGLLAAAPEAAGVDLAGVRTRKGRVGSVAFPDAAAEATWLAEAAAAAVDQYGAHEVAVLARVNRDLEPVAVELEQLNVAYVLESSGFWGRPEVQAMVDLARVVVEPETLEAVCRLANFPYNRRSLLDPMRLIHANGGPIAGYLALSGHDQYGTNFDRLVNKALAADPDEPPGDFYRWLFETAPPWQSVPYRWAETMKDTLGSFAAIARNAQSFASLVAVAESAERHAADPGGKGVRLMSAHKSKGTEYKAVFVMGVEEGRFPHGRSVTDPELLCEERRLLYVATTRATETLTYTWAAERDNRSVAPSRFLAEIGEQISVAPAEPSRSWEPARQ